ncbi:MAG: dihydrodipicolinate synthase [Planctomycetes bacterium DG_23]|nr:MAG: dihydrodipicolinate synthase [Planctomycetes bacterium DG_23]
MKIEGIIPAVVTPFDKDENLDLGALKVIIGRLLEAGVHGIFVVGSTGEFWALSPEEKRRIFEAAVETVAGKVPVYAGTCANSTAETVLLSKEAESAGCDFVSVLTPSFIKPSDEELYLHYKAVVDAIKIPAILYSNPARTNILLSTSLVRRLARDFEQVAGIKDSSGDLTQTAEYINSTPERFSVIAGRDTLIFATLMMGGPAAIAATSNIVPEIVVGIYENFSQGNLDEARKLQRQLAPLRLAFSLGSFPSVIKEAAELKGLPAGPCRRPIGPLTPENREKLKNILQRMEVEIKKTEEKRD